MIFRLKVVISAAAFALAGISANAATVKVTVTGLITSGGDETSFGIPLFSIGDAVTYSATYDTNTLPDSSSSAGSIYDQAATSVEVLAGSYSATADYGNVLINSGGLFGISSSSMPGDDNVVGGSHGSFSLTRIDLALRYGAGAFSSFDLPTSLPNITSLVDQQERLFMFSAGSQDRGVFWNVDSVQIETIVPVPLPAGASLLLLGLAGLGGLRRTPRAA